MKFQKTLLGLFTAAAMLLCAGCGTQSTQPTDTDSAPDTVQSFDIEMTDAVQKIVDRGYLIVGCKDDVPGFGYYNTETETYTGGEIDLAYYIAAKLFDVSYDKAVEQDLVHFEPVDVENRENVLINGDVDYVIATYTITDERKQIVDFSKSYYSSAIGLMINSGNADNSSLRENPIRSISDLDNKYIGIMSGSTTRTDLLNYVNRNSINIHPKFVTYSTYEKMSDALAAGNIDVFCVDVTILKGYLTSGRTILSDRFAAQNYGIAASKECDGLIDVANTVIDELNYNQIVLFS